MPSDPIILFVAMPYTDLGKHAKWRKPQEVEKFYEQVRRALAENFLRRVELRIEKYAPKSGLVIEEMSRAIHAADVFIADLTGHNGNVFFELGLRYGVSQGVTILTTQEDKPLPFDLNQMHFVRYANGPTQQAEAEIVRIVSRELDTRKNGSPFLSLLDLQVVSRAKWEIVAGVRVDALIAEARQAQDPHIRLNRIEEAVQVDRLSEKARLELVRELRIRREFEAALRVAEEALRIFAKSAQIHMERAIILDRITELGEDRLDEAIAACEAALSFSNGNAEMHACFGGTLRRKGLRVSGNDRARYLEAALENYIISRKINRHSTYAGLNMLRLRMLMQDSRQHPEDSLKDLIKGMYHLCAFEVADSESKPEKEPWWRMFDLADILTLMNDRDQALDIYRKAIDIIPASLRADKLISPLRPWRELLGAAKMDKEVGATAECIIKLLESHVPAGS